jgi:hypothetical protein
MLYQFKPGPLNSGRIIQKSIKLPTAWAETKETFLLLNIIHCCEAHLIQWCRVDSKAKDYHVHSICNYQF